MISARYAAYDALIASRSYRAHWGIPNLKLHLVSERAARPVQTTDCGHC